MQSRLRGAKSRRVSQRKAFLRRLKFEKVHITDNEKLVVLFKTSEKPIISK